ncbi:MAG: MFS transporter [Deltaproteobacteria bacterium]|nr:MFS transporter [Deltaproteobacteria bacterium]
MPQRKSSKLIIFLIVFIDLLGFGMMIPMLPFFARHFGADAMQIGWLMFVYSFMQIFVSPLWGLLSDRFGRRPILLITIAGQAAAFLWGGFAAGYLSLLLSRVFAGAFAANISTASAYMADITTKEERAKGMGLIGAAFGLGFIFGPAIGGFLVSVGYEWPSLMAGIVSLINLVFAFFILDEPIRSRLDRSQNRRRLSWEAYKKSFSSVYIFAPMILFFLLTLAFTQLEIVFGLFVSDRFFLNERDAGLMFAGMGIVMAIVQGGLIGRFVKKLGEIGVIRIGLPLVALGLLGLIEATNFWFLSGSLLVMAIGYSLANPCLSAITSKSADASNQGSVLGIYQSMGSLARVFGPLLAGFLYKRSQSAAFICAVLIVFMAQIIFALVYRRSYTQNL